MGKKGHSLPALGLTSLPRRDFLGEQGGGSSDSQILYFFQKPIVLGPKAVYPRPFASVRFTFET